MAQFARPLSDITTGNFSSSLGGALYAAIDEAAPDDGDYIYSSPNSTGYCEVKLGAVTDPASGIDHVVRWRASRYRTTKNLTVVMRLMQGTTQIAAQTKSDSELDSATTFTYTLTEAEANSITDYSDLRLRFDVTVNGGAGNYGSVYWTEFEVPEAVTEHNLVAQDITAGIPVVSKPSEIITHNLTAQDVVAGVPVVDKPEELPATIIDIDHESGDFSEWNTHTGNVSITGNAGMAGTNYGLEADTFGLVGGYAQIDVAEVTTGIVRFRFYFDRNTLSTMTLNSVIGTIFQVTNNGEIFCYGNVRVDTGGTVLLGVYTKTDTTGYRFVTPTLPTGENYFEVQVIRATTEVSGDGRLDVWINGNPAGSSTNFDNYDSFPAWDAMRFGIWGIGDDVTGVAYIDQIVANADGSEIGEHAAQPTHNLTAQDVASGIPSIEKPSIGQTHNLTSQGVTSGIAVVDKPGIGQSHTLTSQDIKAGVPVVGIPSLSISHGLTAQDVTSGLPTVEQPGIGQVHNLAAQDTVAGLPVVDKPVVGQTHNLVGSDVVGGAPVVEQPQLFETQALVAQDVTSGVASVDKPIVEQTHLLQSLDVAAGIPGVEGAALGQTHLLVAAHITSGIPIIGKPSMTPGDELESQDVISGYPVVDSAAIGQTHLLAAGDVAAGNPVVEKPGVGQTHQLQTQDVTSEQPTVEQPTLGEWAGLVAQDVVAGEPTVIQPTIGQVHVLGAKDVQGGYPVVEQPTITQIITLVALSVLAGIPLVDKPYILIDGGTPEERVYRTQQQSRLLRSVAGSRRLDSTSNGNVYESTQDGRVYAVVDGGD